MENGRKQGRKKVLFVVTKSNWGGAQRYVHDLATNLPPQKFEPVVAFGPAPAGVPGVLTEKLSRAGVRTALVPALSRDIGIFSDIAALWQLVSLIRRERPAVLHLNSSKAGGLGALAGRVAGVPRIVFTSHGLPYDEDRFFLSRALIFLATWATFLLCDAVICLSEDTARRAKRLWRIAEKVHLVYNGIPARVLLPRDEARARLAALQQGLPRDALWLGTIAELTRNKGLTYAIEACALARDKMPPFVFLIIGSGEDEKKLETLIAARGLTGTVFLLSFVPDASQYLAAFDIFTLPSVKEGLPYVLLEAAQAPTAVVASDIPGIRDIVEDETSGLLAPPRDPHALSEALLRVAKDTQLRDLLAHTLRERVSATFSLDRMVENTLALY